MSLEMDSETSAAVFVHDTMAPFYGNLMRANCLTEDQLTPPSSPDTFKSRRSGPRLHLSRLLKRSRSSKKTGRTQRASVKEMKAPFPLILPESPPVTEAGSDGTPSPQELRRVPSNYHDLREMAKQQGELPPRLATPLLPSPLMDDRNSPAGSYFRFHNPRANNESSYKSYEDLHILSYYAQQRDIEVEVEEDGYDEEQEDAQLEMDDDLDSVTDDMPQTPEDRTNRETTCSDESDWLANTTSHGERMQRFKARCYQVVEHPMRNGGARYNDDEEVVSLTSSSPSTANTGRCLLPL